MHRCGCYFLPYFDAMALHTYALFAAKVLLTAGHVQLHLFVPHPCLAVKRTAE